MCFCTTHLHPQVILGCRPNTSFLNPSLKVPNQLWCFFLNASNFVFQFYFMAQGVNDQSSDFITLNWVKFTPLAISTACEGHGKDTFINFFRGLIKTKDLLKFRLPNYFFTLRTIRKKINLLNELQAKSRMLPITCRYNWGVLGYYLI